MTSDEAKLSALEARLHRLNESSKETGGVKRRVEREIRNLKKQMKTNP